MKIKNWPFYYKGLNQSKPSQQIFINSDNQIDIVNLQFDLARKTINVLNFENKVLKEENDELKNNL